MNEGPQPGWYPDGAGAQRYWDGAQWTEHRAPGAFPARVPASGSRSAWKVPLLVLGGLFVAFIAIGILGTVAGPKETATLTAAPPVQTAPPVTTATTVPATVPVTAPPTTQPPPPPVTAVPTTKAPPTTKDPYAGETVSQRSARKKANSYLDSPMSFSRKGLIDQLEFEGFPTPDATYGVDAQKANWNEQAAKKAKSYMDSPMSFSRDSLIQQLEFEGFTRPEAEYGAHAVGY